MKNTLTTITFLLFSVWCFAGFNNTNENITEFPNVKSIDLKTISGNCIFEKHNKKSVIVKYENNYKPEDSFEPIIKQDNDKLSITENIKGKNSGNCQFVISVPDNVDITFTTISGSFTAENINSDLVVSTVSGQIILSDAEISGKLNIATVSGNIKIDNSIINTPLNLGSVSGNIEVSLKESPKKDISIGSVSGTSIINLNNNEFRGNLEMKCIKSGGKIDCPFRFDEEKDVVEGDNTFLVKRKTIQNEAPVLTIHTVSGKAKLNK